jgi:hypothetical protein
MNQICPNCKARFKHGELVVPIMQVVKNGSEANAVALRDWSHAHLECYKTK